MPQLAMFDILPAIIAYLQLSDKRLARNLRTVCAVRSLRHFKLLVDAGVFLDLPAYLPAPPPLDLRMRGIAQVIA